MTGQFTGRHMAAIMIAFFGIVIAVNLVLARSAIGTFGGVVVENSYVASQHFNRWLDKARAEKALGWDATVQRRADGRLAATITGAPDNARVSAVAWHPLGRLPVVPLAFASGSPGQFLSSAPLPEGRWRLRIEVEAQGRTWRGEKDLR